MAGDVSEQERSSAPPPAFVVSFPPSSPPAQISTVHLVFMKATFLSERVVFVNMVLFVATFFLFRLMVCPYIWWGIARQALSHSPDNACLPWHLKYATVGFGMTFNLLNSYWGYKVLRKFLRKLAGKEAVKQDNALKDI